MKANRLYITDCNGILAINTFTSCNRYVTEDWSEVINLYIDSELGEYRLWWHSEDAEQKLRNEKMQFGKCLRLLMPADNNLRFPPETPCVVLLHFNYCK